MKLASNTNSNCSIISGQNTNLPTAEPEALKKTPLTKSDPEVVANKPIRRFTAKYKLQILEQADKCASPSEKGALLRREGLYSAYLVRWRKQFEKGALKNLQPKKRGVKAKEVNPFEQKIAALEKEKSKLQRDIKKAHALVELQKKVSEIMGLSMEIRENDEIN